MRWQSRGNEFEQIQNLGEGLTSTVYRARRIDKGTGLYQNVILKVLKFDKFVPNFVQEFNRLKSLRIPGVVQLLGCERFDRQFALVFEDIGGHSLSDLARRTQFDNLEVKEIITQLDSILAELAKHNLYHGDLSPDNILITPSGQVHLIDFGQLQPKGKIVGSPMFMAPERWQGAEPSIEADLFSIGLLQSWLKSPSILAAPSIEQQKVCIRNLVDNQNNYLAGSPDKRHFLKRKSSSRVRERLGNKVSALLAERHSTQVFESSNMTRQPWFLAKIAMCIVLFSTLVPMRLPQEKSLSSPAELRVVSNFWYQVRLNGKPLGYSPLRLTLSPGIYRLEFTRPLQKKALLVRIQAGQVLLANPDKIGDRAVSSVVSPPSDSL